MTWPVACSTGLLDSRKFLATNYTTIPAAIMLAGLAFDERGPRWSEIDFASAESVAGLRIVDPACGSGTLLMAAAQEVLKRARRAGAPAEKAPTIVRTILEEALYGFDVVPAAIHLAASTLCMAEARQVVKDMNLWRVRHDVTDGVARLGSLDFLSSSPSQGNAARLSLFDDEKPSIRRVTGTGEVEDSRVGMPSKCHLVIANPPYTRAGGPGDEKNTVWNPIFGSLLDKRDAEKMKNALRKALERNGGKSLCGARIGLRGARRRGARNRGTLGLRASGDHAHWQPLGTHPASPAVQVLGGVGGRESRPAEPERQEGAARTAARVVLRVHADRRGADRRDPAAVRP